MRITIIGASGHGKVVADIAQLVGYDEIVFLDDDPSVSKCGGFPVVGNTTSPIEGDVFVAIGNGHIRERLATYRKLVTLVHPSAVVARDVTIGPGTVIMAGAVINSGATIGVGCIVNTCASVDHDCEVGDYVHVSVGAHLCGAVTVGNHTWVGAGATVSNGISICCNCTIGAGAVVIRDIGEEGTYVGVPVNRIDNRSRGHANHP